MAIAPGSPLVGHQRLRVFSWCLACCLVVSCMYLLLFVDPQTVKVAPYWRSLRVPSRKSSPQPIILVYSTLFGESTWPHLQQADLEHYLENTNCPVTNCQVTYDKALVGKSDALIFHARDMPAPSSLRVIPRPLHQRWVYFISESPANTPDPTPLNGLFNWTMTFRTDSDIYLPYAQFGRLQENDKVPDPSIDYSHGKTKLVAWIASHCGLLRDDFVLNLEQFIPVDVAGGCSNKYKHQFQCSRAGCDTFKQYKFYLSFENGFCHNYVTEKYWHWGIGEGAVPIVMGGGPYSDDKLVIPGSFINVEDFPSIKALADHLLYLDKNDTAYNEYFKWKQEYRITVPYTGWPYEPFWACRICQMLQQETHRPTKIYNDLSSFWGARQNCMGKEQKVQRMVHDA